MIYQIPINYKGNMQKNKISLLLVILWMIFIFVMSSFDATSSSNQSNFIVDIITSIINIKDIGLLSLIIRKLAHFIEYFILGILVINFITRYDKKIIIAILLCIIYATSDEIHQIFVPGRSCQIIDIMIDSLGSIMGIYLYKLITKKCKN